MDANNVCGDIWYEVLQHLYYGPGTLDEEEAMGRKTIVSLARVLRLLNDCALYILWKRMASLQPIAHIINLCALSAGKILEHAGGSYWVSSHRDMCTGC